MIEFLIPIDAPSCANLREHHMARARRAKRHRSTAKFCTPATAQTPCVVHLTRLGRGVLDDDNLASALKACRDGIADALRVDDGDVAQVRWTYSQRKVKKTDAVGVSVRIERIEK